MNPSVQLKLEENGSYQFTLSGVNVSIANAIRRVILSDIKTLCIDTENTTIEINNTRLHNEILKERLNGIPVHSKDLEKLVKSYYIEVDVKNDTDNIVYVTTKDFKIKKKETNELIKEEFREKIFPKNILTGFYIDFARLGPFIDESIETEQIKLKANFAVRSAKENGTYSVVSKCTYENTKDPVKIIDIWREKEKILLKELGGVDDINEVNSQEKGHVKERIEFEHRDFLYLDSQRYFIENSFDFTIETIGVFTNQEILSKSCIVLQNMFYEFKKDIETDKYMITKSSYMDEHSSTIENSFDIVLPDKDYTFGKVIEFILYEKFFKVANNGRMSKAFSEKNILSYCGFKKFHPHDSYTILRIAFHDKVELEDVRSKLIEASNYASEIYTKIYNLIKK